MRLLVDTEDLAREDAEGLLAEAAEFREVLERPIPKVPALRGRTIASVFFEASTRTRLSFERAARALSADTLTFTPGASSLGKGESLKDTALTLAAMGADLLVVRHRSVGAPARIAEWTGLPVVNAGDGAHQHPTQALLDAFTLRERFGSLEGLRVAIVGDVRRSRVARSDTFLLSTLGATVTLVGPPTLLPVDTTGWPAVTCTDLDAVLSEVDALYLLRVQAERGSAVGITSVPEYRRRFGFTTQRARLLPEDAVVLHPGPMNRGVEIDDAAVDDPRVVVLDQVRNGVAVRMAVLFRLLGGGP